MVEGALPAQTTGGDSEKNVQATTTRPEQTYDPSKESRWTRLGLSLESFKRAPGSTGGLKAEGEQADPLAASVNPLLQQKLKPRHLNMIAMGGSIGTGLFVGVGQALRNGGPGGVLIAWSVIGVMLFNITQALGEMSIVYPVSGGFYTLVVRMVNPALGIAFGYNYILSWCIVFPLEITSAAITVQYWTDAVPIGAWITIFFLLVVVVNVFGSLGYAEEEFFSSLLKILVVAIFVIIGIVMNCGGGPSGSPYESYVGGKYFQDPGAFANGFKGVCAVFVTAAFSFAGTELVGIAATETPNPRKSMPTAVKGTFWRITCLYLTSLLIIGLNIPYDEPRLLGGSGTGTSPFVILVDKARIGGLPHLINATICISVLSIGLSCVYAGSRVLTALAETGFAPRCFTMVDKSGRPLWSVVFVLAWGLLAYINLASSGATIFTWLTAITGLATLISWFGICLAHLRFRAAWRAQGKSVEELPFRAFFGELGSWVGLIIITLVFIAQFYIALWPLRGSSLDPTFFFQAYLTAPVFLVCLVLAWVWKRGPIWLIPAHAIDLDTGRKSWFTVEEMRAYRAERRAAPWYVRMYRILFTN
ncbi:APC amino acid permease [Leucosporidium creatinivorum]|uniref:APC amino acid permease n=1 Tax=Leucosporidium creatinivorum TaxID=106004 RepID=A0A1Y2D276_9BASI|nr:APC amino acid permease [Leucosporidium creatinivorum]